MRLYYALSIFSAVISASESRAVEAIAPGINTGTAPIPADRLAVDDISLAATCSGTAPFNSPDATTLADFLLFQPETTVAALPRLSIAWISLGTAKICISNLGFQSINITYTEIGTGVQSIVDTCCLTPTCVGGTETGLAVGETTPRIPLRLKAASQQC
ncbi:hypothetical protein CC1G_05328 [Coprinopsis cinerea okayama7|uniref:Uncharacterized protein n=1 Tax=Coprinopsis cinerea (strain Okayama-7 / 130 / ATCC MYA-4618 / FGSC 9003) TaxID=240176 RepID=A8NPP2_COPC7|nr:hypothetical protein CC1G_05328 [Coprinopsis cinerea okayama7\|eukprot:XP_001835366.1 hypothetical protein CC1G_05328 [Coprinopsis cinerea okayama7\